MVILITKTPLVFGLRCKLLLCVGDLNNILNANEKLGPRQLMLDVYLISVA